jgi:signal transduction histidine kinase
MLHEFMAMNRDHIIRRCSINLARRLDPTAVNADGDQDASACVDQLTEAVRDASMSIQEVGRGAIRHGEGLPLARFSVSEVTHEYGEVCRVIAELAVELNASLSTDDVRTLNRCVDDVITGAVRQDKRETNRCGSDDNTAGGGERLGFFAHEMRNLINTAIVAFEVLKTGNVGVAGSTGAVLQRSLRGLRTLVDRSIAEVRLGQRVQRLPRFLVSGFIDDVVAAARLDADARHLTLRVLPVDADVSIEGDRDILAAVVGNLLQNAFKFTRPRSTVTLRVALTSDRVFIEVEDQCGGLPEGNRDDLFRPFAQRGTDRSGLGLGLAFSRSGAEAHNGHIHVRDVPDTGCIFTVDLPRLPVPTVA